MPTPLPRTRLDRADLPRFRTDRMRTDLLEQLRKPHQNPDGSLYFEGVPFRPGVYTYKQADGTSFRELVTADVLMDKAALSTLGGVAITLEHPQEGLLTPDNVGRHMVGNVGDTIEEIREPEGEQAEGAGGFVKLSFRVRARRALDAIHKHGLREVSCGYTCDSRPESGVHPVYGAYDCIQGPRTYNHIALTIAGRHGGDAAIRTDSAVQVLDGDAPSYTPSPRGASMNPSLLILASLLGLPRYDAQDDIALGKKVEDAARPLLDAIASLRARYPGADSTDRLLAAVRADNEAAQAISRTAADALKAAGAEVRADASAAELVVKLAKQLSDMKAERDTYKAAADAAAAKEKASQEAAEREGMDSLFTAFSVPRKDSAGAPRPLMDLKRDAAAAYAKRIGTGLKADADEGTINGLLIAAKAALTSRQDGAAASPPWNRLDTGDGKDQGRGDSAPLSIHSRARKVRDSKES